MTNPSTETAVSDQARNQVIRAAGLVGTAFLISRILGLVRDVVTKYYLGVTTLEATAYDTANRFPEAIFIIIAGGAIGAAFIPTFSAYFERDDEAGGWRLFSAVINLVTLFVTLISGLAILFAPQFVDFFLTDLVVAQPEIRSLTIQLMRIQLLSTIVFGASGVVMGALNARQHFLLPALAPIVYNLGIIAGVLTWVALEKPPEMGLAVGAVVGSIGHLFIQLPGLKLKKAQYSAVFTLRDSGVKQVLRLMAPRVLALSFSEINIFIMLYLSGSMPLGSLPALYAARRIVLMPLGILGQAMGIAAFPTFATLAARFALAEMRQILSDSLRSLLFLGLPVSIVLLVLREPLIVLLYQRGVFGAQDAELVAWALLFLSLGLVALTSLEVINRAFFALSDTLTPLVAGGVQVAAMLLLSLWLSRSLFPKFGWLPLGGLALGFSLSNFVEVAILLWLLRRKMGGLNGRSLLDGLWRMGTASLLMLGTIWLTMSWLVGTSALWQSLLGSLIGGIVYLLACWLLRVTEIQQFWGYGRRRFFKKVEVR